MGLRPSVAGTRWTAGAGRPQARRVRGSHLDAVFGGDGCNLGRRVVLQLTSVYWCCDRGSIPRTDIEVNETMQEPTTDGGDANVLPNGAEIHFTDDRDAHAPDRVEFLNGGHVKAIYKNSYEIRVYPPHAIRGVYTHTNHLEDEDWW